MSQPNPILDAANAFLSVHDQWEKLTHEEIRLLKAREIRSAEELMKRKPQLTENYTGLLKHLHEHRHQLSELPDDIKESLRKSQMAFVEISKEYQVQLDMALTSAERLMNVIKDAVTQQNSTSQFYGKTGALMPNEAPRSISVNKKA